MSAGMKNSGIVLSEADRRPRSGDRAVAIREFDDLGAESALRGRGIIARKRRRSAEKNDKSLSGGRSDPEEDEEHRRGGGNCERVR